MTKLLMMFGLFIFIILILLLAGFLSLHSDPESPYDEKNKDKR